MIRLFILFILLPCWARAQVITTIAGTGRKGNVTEGMQATNAELSQPLSLAMDGSGCIFFIDAGNDAIYKISANGTIKTVVGKKEGHKYDPAYGYNGDGGPATNAVIWKPHGIIADRAGNVYFGDYENSVIRMVSTNGIVNTLAGFPDQSVSGGTGNGLNGIGTAHDKTGNISNQVDLYFADEHNHVVRNISGIGSSSVIAGTGIKGYSGDGGLASNAQLNQPWGVVADEVGNVFIADTYNNVIRKISTDGIISTYAGNGIAGYAGDGGPATLASINSPHGISVDKASNLYITEVADNVVRKVDADGNISTFAGNGHRGYSGDKGLATNVQLNWPSDVTVDTAGNVYIADGLNHVVRKVTMPLPHVKHEIQVMDAFTIVADPEKNELVITTDSAAYTSFTIADVGGKVIIRQLLNTVKTIVDIGVLPAARYYLTLIKGDKIKRAMFVKDK